MSGPGCQHEFVMITIGIVLGYINMFNGFILLRITGFFDFHLFVYNILFHVLCHEMKKMARKGPSQARATILWKM